MPCDLFIFAGEKSGDLHGEQLMKNLKHSLPSIQIAGVGGPLMRSQGLECLLPMEKFQVMGFIDVFLNLPQLIFNFYAIAKQILQLNPKCVVFIDYPGFNLRMANHLRKQGYLGKLCHFICPSIWAWGKKRIPFMAKNLDVLLSILPFEKTYFAHTSLPVIYVGNPLIQRFKEHRYEKLSIPKDKTVVALFPGSREKELKRNFPIYCQACKELQQADPSLYFVIAVSDERFHAQILTIATQEQFVFDLLTPPHRSYDLMQRADIAIAKSGTVTLELALHHTPTIVTYGMSRWDIIIARDFLRIRLPFYCLVNIIMNQEIFPELFGPHFTKQALVNQMTSLLQEESKRKQQKNRCSQLTFTLENKNASLQAAEVVLELLNPIA